MADVSTSTPAPETLRPIIESEIERLIARPDFRRDQHGGRDMTARLDTLDELNKSLGFVKAASMAVRGCTSLDTEEKNAMAYVLGCDGHSGGREGVP